MWMLSSLCVQCRGVYAESYYRCREDSCEVPNGDSND
jgi:hypothetical protein